MNDCVMSFEMGFDRFDLSFTSEGRWVDILENCFVETSLKVIPKNPALHDQTLGFNIMLNERCRQFKWMSHNRKWKHQHYEKN